ncbi:MAG: sugar nucleotide-binding protein [Anaerolineae bacterium]
MGTASLPTEAPWLITGAAGLLGSEIVRQAAGRWPLYGAIFQRQPPPQPGVSYLPLDVGDPAAVHALLHALRPRVIIHTAYRKAGPELERVTAAGAGNVAQAATQIDARLIHVSSDVLLDGEHAPYDESAQPGSLHPYGQAKAEAERLVQQAAPAAAMVRTSLICQLDPPDPISSWIIDSLRHRRPITLFIDEIRSPVWVQDLAAALIELAQTSYRRRAEHRRPPAAEPLRDGLAAGPAHGPGSPGHQRRPQPGQRAEPATRLHAGCAAGPAAAAHSPAQLRRRAMERMSEHDDLAPQETPHFDPSPADQLDRIRFRRG